MGAKKLTYYNKTNHYYPFGMLLPNRHENAGEYRYGFQGQEVDNEIKGEGNSVNYKYRMHDPRVGRFFAVDPLEGAYPGHSPYSFSHNVVINAIEFEGLETWYLSDGSMMQQTGPLTFEYASSLGAVGYGLTTTCEVFTSTGVGEKLAENISRMNSTLGLWGADANLYLNCGGDCIAVAKTRVNRTFIDVTGNDLSNNVSESKVSVKTFNSIWNVAHQSKVPEEYRGKGSAGAVEFAKLGEYVSEDEIWKGKLQEGAVVQVWANEEGFQGDGENYGHSFIFLNYTYDDSGTITGMKIADQGYQNGEISKNDWGTWHGANFGETTTEQDVEFTPIEGGGETNTTNEDEE